MEAAPIQVLHVEDDPIQALLVREITSHNSSGQFHVHHADSLCAGLERLRQGGIDLILLDLTLGDSNGLDTLRSVRSSFVTIPIIVFTGSDDESMAVGSLREGAQDYLVKGQARRDVILRTMRYAVERHRMEQELERERALTRHIVMEAPTLICGIQPDGTTNFMNRAVEQVTGYDAQEVVGRNWWTLFYPGDSARQVDGLLESFARLGQVKDYEMTLVCKGGSKRTISWNSVNRLDKQGRIVEIIGIGSDVTERIRVRDALRRSEAFYHSLVESLPQNIFRKDLEGRFTFANQRLCTELELPLSRIIGSTDHDFFPAALAEKYRSDDQRVIATGEMFETVEEYQPPEGPKEYVQVRKTAIRDEAGNAIGIQGIFWDVTERKLAEEHLRQANWELARNREELLKALADLNRSHDALKEAQLQVIQMEKLQLVGRLAAGVAHEVKNPLAVLRMGLDYLASEPAGSNPNVAQILEDMKDAIRRADSIILGLLDFSVPGQLDFQQVNLRELVEESLLLVRHEMHEHAVRSEVEIAANLRPIFLDRNKMKQVFVNLCTNAIHAMPEGGLLTIRACERDAAPGEIESNPGARDTETIRRHEPVVAIEIDDTGSGIPEEKLLHVFDPFFTTKATGEGTGLGLTVTRKIIELHGGGIKLRNRAEGGVRATLLLKTQLEVPCQRSES